MSARLLGLPLLAVMLVAACAPGPAAVPPTPAPAATGAAASAAPAAPVASGFPAVSPTSVSRRQVKVAYPSAALSQMAYMYGEDQGIYARYGVEVEGIIMTTAPAIAALLNGDVQYVFAGSSMLLAAARGLPIRTFLQSSRGPTTHLFARPEITRFDDVRGKTVSVLSAAGLNREITELVLEKHGVNPRDVQYLASGTAPAQMEHLRQGLAVAATISPPWPIIARREGFRSLANIGEEIAYPFGMFATSTARIEQQADEVRAVIQATLESHRLMRDDPTGTSDWVARRFDVDHEVASESYAMVIELQNDDGDVLRDGVTNYFRVQAEQPELRDTRYEDIVDTRLLREVWVRVGLR